jgi:antitoxin component YwqK of YwqJK toxin-antitoxin module
MNQSDKEQINQLDGLNTVWHENGQKKQEITYKNRKKDGLQTEWYENGQKCIERIYQMGEVTSVKEWNEDGSAKE